MRVETILLKYRQLKYRQLAKHRQLVALFVGVAFLALAAAPARGGDVFAVSGIDIRAESNTTATRAKQRAIADGLYRALATSLRRFVPSQQISPFLQSLDGSAVRAMAHGIEIRNEAFGVDRGISLYEAELDVLFDASSVTQSLITHGVSFAELSTSPVFLVPVLLRDGEVILWRENPWFDAWQEGFSDSLVPVVTPLGEAQDFTLFSIEDLRANNRDRLEAFGNEYGSVSYIAVVLQEDTDPLQVSGVWFHPLWSEGLNLSALSPRRLADSAEENARAQRNNVRDRRNSPYVEAARRFHRAMTIQWIEKLAIDSTQRLNLRVRLDFDNAESWRQLRARLLSLHGVESLSLESLTIDEAVFSIVFLGHVDQFRLTIEALGAHYQGIDDSGAHLLSQLEP